MDNFFVAFLEKKYFIFLPDVFRHDLGQLLQQQAEQLGLQVTGIEEQPADAVLLGRPGSVTGNACDSGGQGLHQECIILFISGTGWKHVIMLLRVVQCSGEVFVKLLEDNGLVLHEHTLLLFDLDNHASLGKALHQQGLVSQNILQVSCSLHAPLASRQAQFLSGKCGT